MRFHGLYECTHFRKWTLDVNVQDVGGWLWGNVGEWGWVDVVGGVDESRGLWR